MALMKNFVLWQMMLMKKVLLQMMQVSGFPALMCWNQFNALHLFDANECKIE